VICTADASTASGDSTMYLDMGSVVGTGVPVLLYIGFAAIVQYYKLQIHGMCIIVYEYNGPTTSSTVLLPTTRVLSTHQRKCKLVQVSLAVIVLKSGIVSIYSQTPCCTLSTIVPLYSEYSSTC
jgi:hypothetical protein